MNARVFFAGVAVGVVSALLGSRLLWQPVAVAGGSNTGTPRAGGCPGDFDANGVINTADLVLFLNAFGTACPPDTDGDGFADPSDNCPLVFNPCQEDVDGDGVGNLCDNCPTVPNPGQQDSNNDGIGDACCVSAANCPPRPNASAACVANQCVYTCNTGFADCNGLPGDGCETIVTTVVNCGSCGVVCNLPNAVAACVSGACAVQSCFAGFSNCDSNNANGCEVQHGLAANSCAFPTDLGSLCADTQCGGFCQSASVVTGPVINDRRTRWFRMSASECDSSCPGSMQHIVRLGVPAGVNYDVFIYSACGGTLLGSGTNAAGTAETINLTRPKTPGVNDSFLYWIEVRWISGQSCATYTLSIDGKDC